VVCSVFLAGAFFTLFLGGWASKKLVAPKKIRVVKLYFMDFEN
jgi:hypothetical protein